MCPEFLAQLPTPHIEKIRALLQEKAQWLAQPKKGFLRYQRPLTAVSQLRAHHLDFSGDTVVIGRESEISPTKREQVRETLRSFMPWRKGPWSVFGIDIDAEWRSERKWNRLLPELPDLAGKVIADVGCNNGYYMFRMVPYRPRLVLGFEPYLQHYYAFQTLNRFAGLANLQVLPLGVEEFGLFEGCFDVVFLLGILYHRISPVDCLREIKKAMRPGGTLFIESQAIPGDQPVALFPEKTYAKAPGTYFVPTASCLCNWVMRAGFSDARLFCSHPMSSEEQRRTPWMDFESYEDFIAPDDPTKTIEGYPAPLRVFVKALL